MAESKTRVALVTGGSRGIGLGIARALATDGWDLAINGMRPEADVAEVMNELRTLGRDVLYCHGDVGHQAARESMLTAVERHFGGLQLLVNNAGITSPGRADILDASEDSFDRVMAVNLKGAFFLAQAAAKWMIRQREADATFAGTIINISSVSSRTSSTNRGDYCISRACGSQMTRVLAARLAEYGIGVFEIRPGIIRTDMTAGVTEKYDRLIAEGLTIEPRWGLPEDIGRAAAMLARGELSYAPGTVINVDGGITLLQDLERA
jgi:NAD(P)-dependent dehydrogenase (short-subunit alcohol dehydrogenase family)